MIHPTLEYYLAIGALLFGLGIFTVATRRNAVGMLLGVELILNAGALNFVAFDHFVSEARARASGQVFAIFVIAFAASEAAIALAIVLQVYRSHRTIAADELTELRN
jgi:NADH-quinone oxidoreductase subunit K